MTVQEILAERLVAIGADGLCTHGCGCSIDALCPCENSPMECKPAKSVAYDPELHGDVPEGEYEIGDHLFIEMKDEEYKT